LGKFDNAKKLFKDVVDVNNYVPLASSEKAKIDLLSAIYEKEKIVLLTGEAGTGKSLLLRKIYHQLENEKKLFFIENPYLEIKKVLKLLNHLTLEEHHVMLVDEAQILSPQIWENLRIFADKGNLTIVFATHDTDVKKLLEKKHFKTRINYIISLKKVSFKEMQNFIITKLLRENLHSIAEMFTSSNFKLIYKYTEGSLRATNQLMYKLFDVLDYFDSHYPGKIKRKLSNKYIHIAIMDLRMS